ncbi:hypothetical protein B0H13DRAFT_2317977 [Mycena leptocephala]|nr:hypothetical protein B0H13DRAFT_2317977 [Mycena leptocephala]
MTSIPGYCDCIQSQVRGIFCGIFFKAWVHQKLVAQRRRFARDAWQDTQLPAGEDGGFTLRGQNRDWDLFMDDLHDTSESKEEVMVDTDEMEGTDASREEVIVEPDEE